MKWKVSYILGQRRPDKDLRCPLTESLDNVEYIDEQNSP